MSTLQAYSKQREKSALVKHYHQEELRRLQKKLDQIKHRKKGLLPQNKENSLPLLPPRYILPLTRQFQINDQNDRLSSRIAQMKTKESEYFKKILKQKQRVKNLEYNEKNKKQSQKVKLIYSTSVAAGLLGGGDMTHREERVDGNRSVLLRASTQRTKKTEGKLIV